MLTGLVFEPAVGLSVLDSCARHLADEIRNIWLRNRDNGIEQWEESFSEKPETMHMLRQEGFPALDSMDYIFSWWGNKDSEGLAGEISVIWHIKKEDGTIEHYKTWIRLAELDFLKGVSGSEQKKRDEFREDFIKSFRGWKENYPIK